MARDASGTPPSLGRLDAVVPAGTLQQWNLLFLVHNSSCTFSVHSTCGWALSFLSSPVVKVMIACSRECRKLNRRTESFLGGLILITQSSALGVCCVFSSGNGPYGCFSGLSVIHAALLAASPSAARSGFLILTAAAGLFPSALEDPARASQLRLCLALAARAASWAPCAHGCRHGTDVS